VTTIDFEDPVDTGSRLTMDQVNGLRALVETIGEAVAILQATLNVTESLADMNAALAEYLADRRERNATALKNLSIRIRGYEGSYTAMLHRAQGLMKLVCSLSCDRFAN
jgi:hypothetical protein